jgi:ribose/xylose/arabinose/galactoside ABC-type transport system permease subunit
MSINELLIMIFGLSAIFATLGTLFVCSASTVTFERRRPVRPHVVAEDAEFSRINEESKRQVSAVLRGRAST